VVNPSAERWSDGWPDEPGNDELIQFAEELAATLPTLPAESMRRVEQSLWSELAARTRRRRQAATRYAGLAAAVQLGAAMLFVPAGSESRPTRAPVVRVEPTGVVEDRYEVPAQPGVPVDSRRPLVSIDDYRSLFTTPNESRELSLASSQLQVNARVVRAR
jgi:hypothetical protein